MLLCSLLIQLCNVADVFEGLLYCMVMGRGNVFPFVYLISCGESVYDVIVLGMLFQVVDVFCVGNDGNVNLMCSGGRWSRPSVGVPTGCFTGSWR